MCVNLNFQPVATKFFGISNNWECYETRYTDHSLSIWGVVGPRDHEKQELIGTATFGKEDAARYDPAVSVWLPDNQKVYPSNPSRNGRILYGPMIQHSHLKGLYQSIDGKVVRPISIFLSPNAYWNQIGGYMNGQQFIDIQSNL